MCFQPLALQAHLGSKFLKKLILIFRIVCPHRSLKLFSERTMSVNHSVSDLGVRLQLYDQRVILFSRVNGRTVIDKSL